MRLRLTLQAEADVDHIAAYIHARNPAAARNVEAELKAAFRLIQTNPYVGRETRRGVRRFVLPRYPYLIFYSVNEVADEVSVFSVRHGARRPDPSMVEP